MTKDDSYRTLCVVCSRTFEAAQKALCKRLQTLEALWLGLPKDATDQLGGILRSGSSPFVKSKQTTKMGYLSLENGRGKKEGERFHVRAGEIDDADVAIVQADGGIGMFTRMFPDAKGTGRDLRNVTKTVHRR